MARLRSGRKTQEEKELKGNEESEDKQIKRSLSCSQLMFKIIKNTIVVVVCIYLASPIISLLFPGAITQVIFLNLFGKRWFSDDLSYPESAAINCTGTRNLYIDSTDGVKLGTWQVLPVSVQEKSNNRDDDFFDQVLADGKPIVIYFHGNGGTRASSHRVQTYKILAQLDYHVIATDYRGYADSSGWPSAQGIFEDAESVYHWARRVGKGSPVYLLGHSLGTGVAARVSKRLCDAGTCPAGVILETPFSSLHDAFMHHPFAIPFWVMPGYLWLHAYAMNDTIEAFHSDQCMSSILCPILILHAEDDAIVPFHLGQKLYKIAKEVRPESAGPVKFVNFGRNGYGHKHICDSPELPAIMKEFIV
ncbi:lysophosphatidylserine lipase ABHD12-like [Amphiura filiformis]|uniref:lysophosphatidylserine lipase ABHD12-like n=1 Tax=Amphiura filiformis TaxID=82378 RepID=UPI003B213863